MRPSLSNREGLFAVGDSYSSAQKSSMISAAKQVRHYIGTIEIPGIARGTACLLEDGKVLTCLHNILDYAALDEGRVELIDFERSDASVYFVKDHEIFKYKISAAPVTGINHLRANQLSSWCFDYAFLETKGDPIGDLGGGFKLDKTNHFGSAFVSDPAQTLAISGPFIKRAADGSLKAYRYASLSENQAAEGGFYHITQAGDHPSVPGFSGMGIVPIDGNYSIDTLYAIHSYRDNKGQQTGAKISEIRSSVAMADRMVVRDDARLNQAAVGILKSWYEIYITAKTNRAIGSVTKHEENVILFDEALHLLRTTKTDIFSDSKQESKDLADAWSGSDGKSIHHSQERNKPLSKPHYHHALHDQDSERYPNHIFYPTQDEQQSKNKADRKAGFEAKIKERQLEREEEAEAKKAASTGKKSESIAEGVRKKQEDKKNNSGKSEGR